MNPHVEMAKAHSQHQEQQRTAWLDRVAAESLITAQKSAKAAKLAALAALAAAAGAIGQLVVAALK